MADAAAIPTPFDGTLLERPLQGPPPRAAEDDAPDARLEAVTEQVARGTYTEAARTAEALLREGVHDARLIGPYLFGAFQERGLHAMPGLFRSLLLVLTESHASFGPEDKRAVFTESSVRWLLRTLNKHFTHHEKKNDEKWRRWCEPDCRAPLEEALALTEPIIAALSTALPKNGCEEPFRNLALWLRRHVEALPRPAQPEPAPVAPATPVEQEAPAPVAPSRTEAPVAASPQPAAPVPAQAPVPGLPIAPAMALLLRKLEAFEALLTQGELTKAGIVATDVLATVERFDPRLYLPALFSRFFSGLSAHAHALEPFLQNHKALSRRALEQLYQVDLDAFLAQPSGEPGAEDSE